MQKTAARKHAPCTLIRAADYQVETESVTGSTFIWKKHRFSIFLPGQHQISNAVTALAAAEELMKRLPSEGRRKLEPGENARFIPAAGTSGAARRTSVYFPGRRSQPGWGAEIGAISGKTFYKQENHLYNGSVERQGI